MAKSQDMNQQFQECLKGLSYPASKDEMIRHAQSTCGDQDVVSALKNLPDQTVSKLSDLTGLLPGLHLNLNL